MHPAKAYLFVLVVCAVFCLRLEHRVFAQSNLAAAAGTVPPQLDHFDVTQVDRSLDPCVDFYQYTCKKWIAKNPIPPDQANWWLGAKLIFGTRRWCATSWKKPPPTTRRQPLRAKNRRLLRLLHERDRDQHQGNHRDPAGVGPNPALHSKTELPEELARIHRITFTLAPGTDSGSTGALFGFSSGQDLDDASKVVAVLDQGGLACRIGITIQI